MKPEFKSVATEAIRYWEPRRLFYNGLLILLVLFMFGKHDAWQMLIDLDNLLLFFLLAFLANFFYCFAYLPDLLLRMSYISKKWQSIGRNIVFVSGTVFAMIIAFMTVRPLVDPYVYVF